MLNQMLPTYLKTKGQDIVHPQVAPQYQGQFLPTKERKLKIQGHLHRSNMIDAHHCNKIK